MELEGKTALVTGAGSGIGRASAVTLAKAGARVVIADIEPSGLEGTAAEIQKAGGVVSQTLVDVCDPKSVAQMVDHCIETFGGLDVAHNNAGVLSPSCEFADINPDQVTRVMDVNFWGVFHCLQAEIRQMLKQGGGSIINTGSGSVIVGTPKVSVYCASKHAVAGLTKSVAAEYASRGIRVNCVCPGSVDTPMMKMVPPERKQQMVDMHPIGRFAQPEEIAEAVLWLASPRSGYVIGSCLMIDGGYTLL